MKLGIYKDSMSWGNLQSTTMEAAIKEVLAEFASKRLKLVDRPASNVARFISASGSKYEILPQEDE